MKPGQIITILGLLIIFFVIFIARTANAQDVESLLRQGVELRRQGHEDQALEVLRQAHELRPSGNTAGQLALVEEALRLWPEADRHMREAMESHDAWVERHRDVLEREAVTIRSHVHAHEITVPTPTSQEALPTRVLQVPEAERAMAPESSTYSREQLSPTAARVRPRLPTRLSPAVAALAVGSGSIIVGSIIALVARSVIVSNYNRDPMCLGRLEASDPSQCRSMVSTGDALGAIGITGLALGAAGGLASSMMFFAHTENRSAGFTLAFRM